MPVKISRDEIMASRQFSVRSTPKGDGLFKITKAPASWKSDERSARFFMTTEKRDRYGDIVVAKGGDIADFLNNPVVLWGHNSRAYPIGMWGDIKVVNGSPKRMEGTAGLAPEGTTEQSDDVARLLAAGMVRACSIGFMMKEWEPIDKENPWDGWRFLEWELLECSICSVPANPEALVKAAGGDDRLALQAIELVLDEWARTPEGLIVPRAKFEKAYKVEKGTEVTLHEVRSVDENSEDPALPDAQVERITTSIVDRLAKMFGLKPADAENKTVEKPALTPESVTEINKAAEEEAAKAAAEAAEAEQKRKDAEATAAAELAAEQEQAQARARAMLMTAE